MYQVKGPTNSGVDELPTVTGTYRKNSAIEIRLANYAKKGVHFHAFTSLSTGLERIGKLCLMLDRYATSGGSFPTQKELKQQIGHRLELLYERCQEMIKRRGIKLTLTNDLSNPVHKTILSVLNDFAEGDRYSNIDLLVGRTSGDPIACWYSEVDMSLYITRVTQKRKDQIAQNAKLVAQMMMGHVSSVLHTSETGDEMTE